MNDSAMDNSGGRPASGYSDYPDELPIIVRCSEVLNLMVMDRGTMQEVGRVERLWMYPQAHRVLGLICKGGGLLSKQRWAYKLPQIESLNRGNIWIEGAGTATSPDQIRQLETLIDHEIWVDGGDRLGVIVDCLFNRKTGQITQYLFVNNPLRRLIDAPNPLRPEEILSFGNQRALVSPQAVARLRRERPNLRQTFTQMKEQARAEYEQVTQQTQARVRTWGEEAKSAKARLSEQASLLKQQAAERAKALQEQAAQDILPQLSEQAQELTHRVGEQYHTVQRRAQDFVEELPPLEQLTERYAAGPGRGDDNRYDNRQSYDEVPERGRRSEDENAYGDGDSRDRNSQDWANQGRDIQDRHSQNEPDDYRHRRRRRYRQNSDDNTPFPGSNRWESDPSAELTWVDEAGELPPVEPPLREVDSSRTDRPAAARWDGDRRESPSPRPFDPTPSQQPSPERSPELGSRLNSRDNPWGYADSATESDWDDFEFPQVSEPLTAPTQDSWIDSAAQSREQSPEAQTHGRPQSLDPSATPQPQGDGLAEPEDDDPWV